MTDEISVQFGLANESSVEMIETAHKGDLGSEVEPDFAQAMCGGFIGRVGTREIPRNIGAEIKAQIEKPGELIAASLTNLLLIPHHFSVRKAKGGAFRGISSVGIVVDFLPGDQSFSIVDLLPNSTYKKTFEARAVGEVELSFSTITNSFVPASVGAIVDAATKGKEGNGPRFGFSMNFGHAFYASEIAAMGVGTSTAVFEFFAGSEPLENKDLTTWSAVAFNKDGPELHYRIRLFYTSRLGVIPKRCESGWTDCVVRTG